MIPVIDSWGAAAPPPGAADDDDLLSATGADGAIVIGDRTGVERARAMGVVVLMHIGVQMGPAMLTRRRVRSMLPSRGDLVPMSIWTAGVLGRAIGVLPEPRLRAARPRSAITPFVLPIASDPRRIDAHRLVLATGLIEAAGASCLMGLPNGASHLQRARRLLSESDRLVAIEALAAPAPTYIRSADILLDCGITPGGAIDHACNAVSAPRIDVTRATTPTSIAIELKAALRQGATA